MNSKRVALRQDRTVGTVGLRRPVLSRRGRGAAFIVLVFGAVYSALDSDAHFERVAEAAKAKFNKVVAIGDHAPEWAGLSGVDDKQHSLDDYRKAQAVVVVFTCNHCPV